MKSEHPHFVNLLLSPRTHMSFFSWTLSFSLPCGYPLWIFHKLISNFQQINSSENDFFLRTYQVLGRLVNPPEISIHIYDVKLTFTPVTQRGIIYDAITLIRRLMYNLQIGTVFWESHAINLIKSSVSFSCQPGSYNKLKFFLGKNTPVSIN